MNQHFLEKVQIASGFVPVDLQTGANAGDWVNMENYGRCAVVFFAAVGTAGDDPTLTLLQATDVAGTGSKAVTFTRVDHKQGADLEAVGQFTEVSQTAANTYTDATSAEILKIWVVDIMAEDLDIDGGFSCLNAAVADVGLNAQLGCMLYMLHDPRIVTAALPSAIA